MYSVVKKVVLGQIVQGKYPVETLNNGDELPDMDTGFITIAITIARQVSL